MNFTADFEMKSLAELEPERELLLRQKRNLETDRETRENELRQAQNSRQSARGAVQQLIEQIVSNLLPDLSSQTLAQLERIFPNEPNLYAAEEMKLPEQLSFAQKIRRFWRRLVVNSETSTASPLEQRRVLLRGLLWRLSDVPAQSRSYRDLIQPMLQKKQEFSVQENAVNASEARANQVKERLKEVSARLSACEKAIARKKARYGEDDSFHDRSPVNSSSSSPIIFSDSTNFDSSSSDSTSAASSSDDFSFGGGGDAGGGGAGG
ncbi:MAG: hypothetical protein ABI954_12525, partial [Pyrinomonadaceae bacterium]